MKHKPVLLSCMLMLCAAYAVAGETRPEWWTGFNGRVRDMSRTLHRDGASQGFMTELNRLRADMLTHGRKHGGSNLTYMGWGSPLRTGWEWTLRHKYQNPEPAAQSVRRLMSVLRANRMREDYAAPKTAMHVVLVYVELWADKAPAVCARLLDEIDEWVRSVDNPRLTAEWHSYAPLCNITLMGVASRKRTPGAGALYRAREQALVNAITDEAVPLHMRTWATTEWAKLLMQRGLDQQAERMLMMWWDRFGERIRSIEYYSAFMTLSLHCRGDWERSSELLEYSSGISTNWTRPSSKQMFSRMARMYYDNMFNTGSELRRRRAARLQKEKEERRNR